MLNKAILMGRLARDPELRYTQNNVPVCSFRIAVDRDRKSTTGEKQTDFFDCVSWYRQAEFASQWFRKGMLVIVAGRIQLRLWTDRNGVERLAVEIHCDDVMFGETKKAREAGGAAASSAPRAAGSNFNVPNVSGNDFEKPDEDDDDVPF